MPKQDFLVFNQEVVTSSSLGIDGNGTFELTGPEISNAASFKSLRLVMQYDGVTPGFGQVAQSFDIDCEVEGYNGSVDLWFPIAYQFRSFRNPEQGKKRIIMMLPSMAGFDAGVDDIVWVADKTEARISRQQGNLPDSRFRVKVKVTERDFGGAGAFQSVNITAFGEAFDA